MAELTYYCGTMDSGKSTLALQTAHNHQSRGRTGLIFTNQDRAGVGVISSRLGLQSAAIEVAPELDIHKFVVDQLSIGSRVDYIICDEANNTVIKSATIRSQTSKSRESNAMGKTSTGQCQRYSGYEIFPSQSEMRFVANHFIKLGQFPILERRAAVPRTGNRA